jgi:hypothetical protein
MKKIFSIISVCALLAAPVFAQDKKEEPAAAHPTAQQVDAAVQAIDDLAVDETKVDAYCAIIEEEDAVPEGDAAGAEAVRQKLDTFLAGLGEGARMAFALDETIDPVSEEGQRLGGAFLRLEEACAS